MNFLLRKQALPTQVTATQLPPIWFSWGSQSAYIKRHDGSTRDISLDELDQVGVNDAQFVRIFLQADILEAVDLIDTPGISDPKISTDVWRRAVGQANGVLWCTHSTQAWRETERATWVALPERLQNNSLLLITRADALGQKDRQKVLRRVNREAGHLFNRTILFSARDAIIARDKTGDAETWARSGGGKMVDSFLEITEQIMDRRADQLVRYQVDKSLSDTPTVAPERVANRQQDAETSETLKLVDPVQPSEVSDNNDVITSFPVRPSRVERRTDDSERPRIEADEAERLRAEMVPDELPPKDELRALFAESPSDPLDLNALAESGIDVDEFDFLDEDDLDSPELIVVRSDDNETTAEDSDEQEETPEAELAQPDQDPEPSSEIESSVSSITALLSEQSGEGDEEYEPEPESNALAPVRVVSISDEPQDQINAHHTPEETSEAEATSEADADHPLSASAMWSEVVATKSLPDDAKGLRSAFAEFLTEFDQIAREHNARKQSDDPSVIPNAGENGRPEWHVL